MIKNLAGKTSYSQGAKDVSSQSANGVVAEKIVSKSSTVGQRLLYLFFIIFFGSIISGIILLEVLFGSLSGRLVEIVIWTVVGIFVFWMWRARRDSITFVAMILFALASVIALVADLSK